MVDRAVAMIDHPGITTSSFFEGHLGHLTPAQEEALATFRQNLEKAKLYIPAQDDVAASHDQPTLLRFLRAQGFQPTAAEKQFLNAETWRKEHDVDNLYATFDPEEFEKSKVYYPRWTGRRDKNGLPLFVYRLASVLPMQTEIYAVRPERLLRRIIVLYESMVRFAFPLCTHLPHPPNSTTPISSVVSIIDLEDVPYIHMWSLRQILQESSQLATANYPETLGMIAIVNAPPFFSIIWGWVELWFDKATLNRIHILGTDPGPKLRKLIHPKDLPKAYGGELDWKFEDEPLLDEEAIAALGTPTVPKGPVVFIDGAAKKPELPPKVVQENGDTPPSLKAIP